MSAPLLRQHEELGGGSKYFGGTIASYSYPDTASLDALSLSDYLFAAWVRPGSGGNNNGRIFGRGAAGSTATDHMQVVMGNGLTGTRVGNWSARQAYDGGTHAVAVAAESSLPNDAWSMIAAHHKSSTRVMRLFRNGASQSLLSSSTGTGAQVMNDTSPIYVGDSGSGVRPYQGRIGRIFVFDVSTLSDTDINTLANDLYNAGTGTVNVPQQSLLVEFLRLGNHTRGDKLVIVGPPTTQGNRLPAPGPPVEYNALSSGTPHETNPADSVTMSDDIVVAVGRNVSVSDSVTPSDALVFDRQIVIPDTVSLADALALERQMLLADTIGLSDLATAERGINQSVDDSVGLADNATPESGKGATIEDSVSLSDAQYFDRTMVLADVLGLSDAATPALDISRIIEDSVGLADLASTQSGKSQTVDDSVSVTDAQRFDRQIVIADTISLSDQVAFDRQIVLSDPVALADAIALQYGLTIQDVLDIADAIDPELTPGDPSGIFLEINDTVSLSDALSFVREVVIADSVEIQDSNARQLNGLFLPDGAVAVETSRGVIIIGRF